MLHSYNFPNDFHKMSLYLLIKIPQYTAVIIGIGLLSLLLWTHFFTIFRISDLETLSLGYWTLKMLKLGNKRVYLPAVLIWNHFAKVLIKGKYVLEVVASQHSVIASNTKT